MTKQTKYEFHELANLFPLMEGKELDDLAADIKANGQRDAILLYGGRILDGRNRYLACHSVGIEPRTAIWGGSEDLVAFVISKNLRRRHLSESQRADIAAQLRLRANLPVEKAASLMNVSERSVKAATRVQTKGIPELAKAVQSGKVSVATAAKVAKMKPAKQRKLIQKGPEAIIKATRPTIQESALLGDGSIQALRFHWKHADEETKAIFQKELREELRKSIAPSNGKTDQFGRPHAAPGSLLKGARS